jgi:hypothetical protein
VRTSAVPFAAAAVAVEWADYSVVAQIDLERLLSVPLALFTLNRSGSGM